MAESAGKQLLLSALTEGHEKGNTKSTAKKGGKTSVKSASPGKGRNRGGQTSKCKQKSSKKIA